MVRLGILPHPDQPVLFFLLFCSVLFLLVVFLFTGILTKLIPVPCWACIWIAAEVGCIVWSQYKIVCHPLFELFFLFDWPEGCDQSEGTDQPAIVSFDAPRWAGNKVVYAKVASNCYFSSHVSSSIILQNPLSLF
jgi:hypothetical protein